MLPRGDRGGRGPRLRQGHGRAHGRHRARRGGAAARLHGHLQRLVRQDAGAGAGRHGSHGHHQAAPLDRLDPHRAGAGQLRARHRQAGRPAHEPGRAVQLHPARLPRSHDRAQGAGLPVLRPRPAGVEAAGGHGRGHAGAGPLPPAGAAPGRAGRHRGGRGVDVRREKPAHHRRLHGAESPVHALVGGAGRRTGGRGGGPGRAPQLPQHAPAGPERQGEGAGGRGRRDPRTRRHGPLRRPSPARRQDPDLGARVPARLQDHQRHPGGLRH